MTNSRARVLRDLGQPILLEKSRYPAADIMVRGMLIIAIVVGHSRLLTSYWPWFFGFAYKWHVHGFFFLALASRGFRGASPRAIDILVRFMVPFVVFLTLATSANALRGHFSLLAYVEALAVGSARLINAACDMSLFWFLPAFAGFLLIVGGVKAVLARSQAPLVVLCAICALCFCVSYVLPRGVALYVPLGMPIVAYIFPSAVLFCALNYNIEKMRSQSQIVIGGACLILIVVCLKYVDRAHLDISLFKYGQGFPAIFLFGIAISVSANLFLKVAALHMPDGMASTLLSSLGRASLVIFLVHSFVQAPLVKVLQPFLPQDAPASNIAAALAIAGVSILSGLWADAALRRLPRLRALVLPHDRDSYIDALRGARHP